MSYTRCVMELWADNAHADGMITTRGGGRDWEATEPREDQPGWTPDVWGQYGWDYAGKCEYLSYLRGVAPIRTYTRTDMSLAAWTVVSGLWREGAIAGNLDIAGLHYYDGLPDRYAAGAHGVIESDGDLGPNLRLGRWRMGGAPVETAPALGAEYWTNPDNSVQYGLHLPGLGTAGAYHDSVTGTSGAELSKPLLLGKPATESVWTVIDQLDAGAGPRAGSVDKAPVLEIVRVELDDGVLAIRLNDHDRPWVYAGEWQTAGGAAVERIRMGPGPIRVVAIGGTIIFDCCELAPPASATVRPYKFWHVPADLEDTPGYRILADTPAGTGISAAVEYTGGTAGARPVVTMTATGQERPVLYCVQDYRTPTIGGAVSAPGRTQGNANFKLLSMSGEATSAWRGATMEADVVALPGQTLNDVRPNTQLKGLVNVDDGGTNVLYDYTDAVTGIEYSTQFTGRVIPPERGRTGIGGVRGTLRAADYVDSNLARMDVIAQCSFEGNGGASGWNVVSAYRHLLNCCGVPDSRINIHADITAANLGAQYYLPGGTARGSRHLKFGPGVGMIEALDTLVGSVGMPSAVRPGEKQGLRWGQAIDGDMFLAPAYEHVPAHYDWELDESTATAEDLVTEFRSSRSLDDFRNALMVMAGEGIDAAARTIVDMASWSDPTAASFIGAIWSRFEGMPDASDVDAIAQDLWEEVARWNWLARWEMVDCPWILPDHDVMVTVTGVVPAGSVWRVISKRWSAEDGRYRQSLKAVRVD